MASNPQLLGEELKKAKLKKLFVEWLHEKVRQSNIGIPEANHIKLKDNKYLKFHLHLSDEIIAAVENKHLSPKSVYLVTKNNGKHNSPHKEDKQLIKTKSMKFNNPSDKNIERDLELKSDYEDLHETEHTSTTTDSLDLGLGASAYGADLNIGYKAEWSSSDREKKSTKNGEGTAAKIPIVIPPGGATYTFDYYREAILQDYGLSLFLRGNIEILFKNENQIIYNINKGKFEQANNKIGLLGTNKLLISINQIFKELKAQDKFPKASNWQFNDANDSVTYQDIISRFQFFGISIVSSTDAANAPNSTKKILSSIPADPPPPHGAQDTNTGKPHTISIKSTVTGVSLPAALAKGIFQSDIRDKLKAGLNANPNYKFVLETITKLDPVKNKDLYDKLFLELAQMRNGVQDPNIREYFLWLEKNRDKVNFNISFESDTTDAYVREELAHSASSSVIPSTEHDKTNSSTSPRP